jgi:hypothetical protein
VTVRLLLDETYPPKLAVILRRQGHDVIAVAAVPELVGLDDGSVLAAANAQNRCVVTENVHDFAVLVRYADHSGVLFANGRRWPRTRAGLGDLAKALDALVSEGSEPGPMEVGWLS